MRNNIVIAISLAIENLELLEILDAEPDTELLEILRELLHEHDEHHKELVEIRKLATDTLRLVEKTQDRIRRKEETGCDVN